MIKILKYIDGDITFYKCKDVDNSIFYVAFKNGKSGVGNTEEEAKNKVEKLSERRK